MKGLRHLLKPNSLTENERSFGTDVPTPEWGPRFPIKSETTFEERNTSGAMGRRKQLTPDFQISWTPSPEQDVPATMRAPYPTRRFNNYSPLFFACESSIFILKIGNQVDKSKKVSSSNITAVPTFAEGVTNLSNSTLKRRLQRLPPEADLELKRIENAEVRIRKLQQQLKRFKLEINMMLAGTEHDVDSFVNTAVLLQKIVNEFREEQRERRENYQNAVATVEAL